MNKRIDARRGERGQVLAGVIMLMLLLLIMVPALVKWTQIETTSAVKNQTSTTAFNLAEAAVERGYWKIQSTTQTWAQANSGTVIAGYNFDTTYRDVPGGTYRIKISSAGTGHLEATIVGEGRDSSGRQVRAISALYKDQTIYSPLMATGGVNTTMGLCPLWGPLMSQGNIVLKDNQAGNRYFPRKFARGYVVCDNTSPNTCNPATNARDTNGLTPPNTDSQEWWSDYQNIPPLPVLDFAALRSSAAATGTLNVYGCKGSATYTNTVSPYGPHAGAAPWDGRGSCTNINAHTEHFSASYNHPFSVNAHPNNSYVWYYDGNVTLGGDTVVDGTYGVGLRGTLIVRGNLTLDANGDYNYTGNVPVNAWAEFGRLDKTTNDTSATNEYPADNGFQKNTATFVFGPGGTYHIPATGGATWRSTVGMRGFTYVGGDLNVTTNGFMDFNGAVWVNGNVIATGASATTFCGVYFDDTLTLPTLNVILVRQSWNETSPSSTAWP